VALVGVKVTPLGTVVTVVTATPPSVVDWRMTGVTVRVMPSRGREERAYVKVYVLGAAVVYMVVSPKTYEGVVVKPI
jgi:hypothetical protein